MYQNIMIPVDLAHRDSLEKAIDTGIDLAKLYGSNATLVGVTTSAPSSVAHNPAEFNQKLEEFAQELTEKSGIKVAAKTVISNDPTIDLDSALRKVAANLNIDLVVMASHIPGLVEYLFASQAGYFASHAEISVFVVR
ncbi:MAG: universal stress protein [Hyphomicrobiaceae bacterium]